ncbi:unnamed protein product [Periconia digitata]|uniref:Uncharacterized protein n=1 Tax=Periconia digitata TaxID=1303443 RepID=A0A9W4XE80_9PLEO|nr:unnamed protein product [Periconia digitata]
MELQTTHTHTHTHTHLHHHHERQASQSSTGRQMQRLFFSFLSFHRRKRSNPKNDLSVTEIFPSVLHSPTPSSLVSSSNLAKLSFDSAHKHIEY